MKKGLLLAVLLAACAKPPQIAVTAQVRKISATAGNLKLAIRNVENRATTPIWLDASVQPAHGAPIRVIHPAPFVLNRHETREIVAPFVSDDVSFEPVLVIREGETGKDLQPVSLQVLPATSPPQVPATSAPATPLRHGK